MIGPAILFLFLPPAIVEAAATAADAAPVTSLRGGFAEGGSSFGPRRPRMDRDPIFKLWCRGRNMPPLEEEGGGGGGRDDVYVYAEVEVDVVAGCLLLWPLPLP